MLRASTIPARYALYAVLSSSRFMVLLMSNFGQPVIYPVKKVFETLFLGPSFIGISEIATGLKI